MPVIARHARPNSLPSRGAPARPGPDRLGAGFIEKHAHLRRYGGDSVTPGRPGFGILCGGNHRLFVDVRPSRASARHIVAGLTCACPVAVQAAPCSARVASGLAATCARTAAVSSSVMARGRPEGCRGSHDSPASCVCFHRLRLRVLTPVDGAISTIGTPDATACSSRSRRSREYPRGMTAV